MDKQEDGTVNRYFLERRRWLGSEKYGKDDQDANGDLNRGKGNATAQLDYVVEEQPLETADGTKNA